VLTDVQDYILQAFEHVYPGQWEDYMPGLAAHVVSDNVGLLMFYEEPSLKFASGTLTVWVPVIRSTSCDLRILMDQPTESISSRDTPSGQDDRWLSGSEGWRLPQRAMRTVPVVMVNVLGQYSV
jgi:hypothetical protein